MKHSLRRAAERMHVTDKKRILCRSRPKHKGNARISKHMN